MYLVVYIVSFLFVFVYNWNVRCWVGRQNKANVMIIQCAILVMYAFVVPENLGLLFLTFPGQLMLVVAVLLNLLAYFWALKILQPDL